jgi:hypothetical protein
LLFAVGGALSAAEARVSSRAPDATDYAGITHAFRADPRLGRAFRAHSRILEIRETLHGPLVARVLFVGLGAYATDLAGHAFSAFYFKPTGEWTPDPKVSKKLARSLGPVPGAWYVRYRGSGTETRHGSSPGEVADNPDCQIPATTEKGQSSFSFSAGWTLDVNGMDRPGVGSVNGTGTEQTDEQPGCISMLGPVAPQSAHCSVTTRGSLLSGDFHSQLSAMVDGQANHELRLRLPIPSNTPPTCGAPEAWEHSADGPIVYEHSIFVPDAKLAAGASFVQTIGANTDVFDPCLFGKPDVTCSAQMSWTGTISFTPAPRPKLNDMNFTGPAPGPSYPSSGGSRG